MIKISFTGDICFNGIFEQKIKDKAQIFSPDITKYLVNQEFVCGNFEGPETDSEESVNKSTTLKNVKGAIPYLVKNGFNIFNLANNHICDYNKIGLTESIDSILNHKKIHLGAGINYKNAYKPIIIKKDGMSLALIAFSEKDEPQAKENKYGVATLLKLSKLRLFVKAIKKKNDKVILMYHGGEEFSKVPSPRKRNLLREITEETDVDAVIAHHSHVFQGVEYVKNKPIFYSLGNFVFDLINHEIYPQARESAILSLNIDEKTISFNFIPTKCNVESGMVEKGESSFINEINNRSDFSDYKRKWRNECYNLVFERPKHEVLNPDNTSLQKKSIARILISIKFYKRIFSIITNYKLRDLYWNAIYFKLIDLK